MSAFLGITLGLGCALTFAYLISQVAVRLWDHSIQDAINAYAVKKRLREIRERNAYGDIVEVPADMWRGQQGLAGGGRIKADPSGRHDIAHRDGSVTR